MKINILYYKVNFAIDVQIKIKAKLRISIEKFENGELKLKP